MRQKWNILVGVRMCWAMATGSLAGLEDSRGQHVTVGGVESISKCAATQSLYVQD